MLTMTKKEYYKKPKNYRSIINGKPHVLMLNPLTGGTILAPVIFIKNNLKGLL